MNSRSYIASFRATIDNGTDLSFAAPARRVCGNWNRLITLPPLWNRISLRMSLDIQRCGWDNKMFSICYKCSRCVSTTNLLVFRSGKLYKYVDRRSHYPEVEVTWEEDAEVQIRITCHCSGKIEFNNGKGRSGSIEVISQ